MICGLSGCAGEVTLKEEKIFKTLLVISSLRGMDSTGAASISRYKVNGDHAIKIAKALGPFPFLFETKAFDKLFQGTLGCLIGHNRSKTTGDTTLKSAHPFMFADIIGAHNGTVDYANKSRMVDGNLFRTDSEAIFNNIQEEGIEETILKLDKTEAYALTWYDKRDHTINMIRNEKRPLYYAFANKGKLMFWASEYIILMAAMMREDIQADDKKVHLLTPDTYFKWNIPLTSIDKFEEAERKRLKNREPYTYIYGKKTQANGGFNALNKGGTFHNYQGDGDFDDSSGEMFAHTYTGVTPVKSQTAGEKVFQDALKAIDENAPVTDIRTKEIMSTADVVRKRAFEHAEKANIVPVPKPEAPVVKAHDGMNIKLYFYIQPKKFTIMKYENNRKEWAAFTDIDTVPIYVPYNIQDINSRQCFKHKGKRENKKVYYRGYRKLLDREQFELIMKRGCLNCNRNPEWGNLVMFVTPEDQFLCEYCSMNKDNVQAGRELTSTPMEKVA